MADFHPVLSVSVEEDLLPLSALLHQRGVVHRVFEQNGQQILAVQQAAQSAEVESLYRQWRAGDVSISLERSPKSAPPIASASWREVPVTVLLIALSVVGFLMVYLGAPPAWLASLTFTPVTIVNGQAVFGNMGAEYWRLVTPVFLHFGWLHIAFNSLWLWELGSKVERVMGHLNMLLLFVVIAIVSNGAQHAFGGPSLFGGMSGVVYGLLGFAWVAPLLQPAWQIQPSQPIMLFMVGWLIFCMTGFTEIIGFGAIANAAHLGGLICGAVLGGIFGLASRRDKA
ncbi:MAG: rhomboid family intramembrane serine protease [Pseudomonadota bacterium]